MMFNSKYLLSGLIFSILILIPQSSFADVGSVEIESYDVSYNLENGNIESIFLEPDFIELIITMTTTNDGTLEITIPRGLLDAKFESSDDIFFILVDGFETEYIEKETTSSYRTLVIPFFNGDSVIDIIGTDALNPFEEPEIEIPSWIKNNAGWWSDDQIDDETYIQGIQYLINEGIMNIPETQSGQSSGSGIPSWIKNNAGWWSDDQIDDETYIQGIQYLIEQGIIKV